MLSATYTVDTIAPLKSLTRELSESVHDARLKITALQHTLQPYSNLDPVYLALLDEYKKLKADLNFCKGTQSCD